MSLCAWQSSMACPALPPCRTTMACSAARLENGLDETMHRLGVSLLAYSPLAFGLLTGKYDEEGLLGRERVADVRLRKFESARKQRWGRPDALKAARKLQRAGPRVRLDAQPDGFGFLLHQVAESPVPSSVCAPWSSSMKTSTLGARCYPEELLKKIDEVRWEMPRSGSVTRPEAQGV